MRTIMMCGVVALTGLASAQQPQPQDQPANPPAASQPDKPKMGMGLQGRH